MRTINVQRSVSSITLYTTLDRRKQYRERQFVESSGYGRDRHRQRDQSVPTGGRTDGRTDDNNERGNFAGGNGCGRLAVAVAVATFFLPSFLPYATLASAASLAPMRVRC